MLTFGTFMEHAAALFERESKVRPVLGMLPPLLDSHIFWLDDDLEFQNHVHEIRTDLIGEMRERVHLPFPDTTTVSVIRTKGPKPIWTLDRLIEDPPYLKAILEDPVSGMLEGQRLLVVRYQVMEDGPIGGDPIFVWMIDYHGVKEDNVHFSFIPSRELHRILQSNIGMPSEEKWKQFQYESKVLLDYAAAISHPENYIVAVTPDLTPKEERRGALGRPRPPQKTRHFIVVDHTVLVRMRQGPQGTHASPIPHERRGHWRRISERCRHARLLGKERVFVRPALVGDPGWRGEKNLYEVLPYLNGPKTSSISS